MPGDSSFISLRSSGNARLRSTARSGCRLIIKSDKLADLQNGRGPEVFYRSVVLLSIRAPRGHVESQWSRRESGHLHGAFRLLKDAPPSSISSLSTVCFGCSFYCSRPKYFYRGLRVIAA
jgi:hypothetical protein